MMVTRTPLGCVPGGVLRLGRLTDFRHRHDYRQPRAGFAGRDVPQADISWHEVGLTRAKFR